MTKNQKTNRTQIRDLSATAQKVNKQQMKQVKGGKEPEDRGVSVKSPCPVAKCGLERGHSNPHNSNAPSSI